MLVAIYSFAMLVPSPQQSLKPAQLSAAESGRAAFKTAHVEWSRTEYIGIYAGDERFFTSRLAGKSAVLAIHGTEDGVVTRQGDGAPSIIGVSLLVFSDGQRTCYRLETAPYATFLTGVGHELARDIRATGFGATGFERGTVEELVSGSPQRKSDQTTEWTYRTRRLDGLHVVTARASDGRRREWWLDAKRGWNPVRFAKLDESGRVVAESLSTLKDFDGTWFPDSVRHYVSKNPADPFRLVSFVRIYDASFDRPDHSKTLKPYDIGLDVGLQIRGFSDGAFLVWDGNKTIPLDEYRDRLETGDLKTAERVVEYRFRARQDRARGIGARTHSEATRAHNPSDTPQARIARKSGSAYGNFEYAWERHTREFTERYALNAEQRQEARAVLKSCLDSGRSYDSTNREDARKLEQRAIRILSIEDEAEKLRAWRGLEVDRRRFLAAISAIFENDLKSGLEKILMPGQRTSTEEDGAG